ncbi:MAG: diphthine synthase [Thermoplasmata archaeon]|nr:diphthine synthase [Thermoplasmata archaeon]
MGALVFIGLGLYDLRDLTARALDEVRGCDLLFAEFYTSRLVRTSHDELESVLGREIRVLNRKEVEEGQAVLDAARTYRVGFLAAGDSMAATTHVDLRLRAHRLGIPTRVVPGLSALTAAAGALGLQHYKFGRTTTLPIQETGYAPTSPYEVVETNRGAGLHTLALLDLKDDHAMTPKEGFESLLEMESRLSRGVVEEETVACLAGALGSPEPTLKADRVKGLLGADPGPPPHSLVLPGPLHFMEVDALQAFAGLPADLADRLRDL